MIGENNKETSFKILDAFYDAGGNFIDTANNYQDEESEIWVGEWMKKRNNRAQIVIATKFTSLYKKNIPGPHVNFAGNSVKSLKESVEASLKKLQTDYIDLLYVHWWDYTMSIPELMQALNHLVQQGKVLALGISDSPAWIVSKANEYARSHGFAQFSVYQGRWNAALRDMERDILPMCSVSTNGEGMAICPWDVLGGGRFKTEAQIEEYKKNNEHGRKMIPPNEKDKQITVVLEKIAKEVNGSVTGVALAYVIQKVPYVYPIVGCRKVEHLQDNINALGIVLTDQHFKEIEGAIPFDVGFPHNMVGTSAENSNILASTAYYDWVSPPKPIQIKK